VLPDIDAVHAAAGTTLPDASADWFQDRTPQQAQAWVSETEA
jgi:hypothetical protein